MTCECLKIHYFDFGVFCSTVTGLMNQCAKKLISEVVLLVPVLHLLRKPGAMSDPNSNTNEPKWAGLEHIDCLSFRERIRGVPDKRRFVQILLEELVFN